MKKHRVILSNVVHFFKLWLIPIFKSHPELSIDKRFPLRESLHSVHLRAHIEKCWTNELLASIDSNRKPRFFYAIWRCYGPAYVIVSTCLLMIEFLCALQAFLYYFYAFGPSLIIVLLLWSVSLLYVVTKHLWKASVTHMGIQLRVSLQTLLLKKVLLIDTSNVQYEKLNKQVTRVVRRLSNLDNLFLFTPYIIVSLLYAIAVAVLLAEYYRFSTHSIILTMAVLFVLIPYHVLLAYKSEAAGKNYIRQCRNLNETFHDYRKGWDEVTTYGLNANIAKSIKQHRLSSKRTMRVLYAYECALFLISLNYTKVAVMVFLLAHTWFNEYLPEEKVLLLLGFLEIFMYPLSVSLSRSITLTAEFVKTINCLQDVFMMIDKAIPNLDSNRKDSSTLIHFTDVQAVNSSSLKLRCDHLVIGKAQTVAFPYEIPQQTKKTLLRLLTGEIDLLDGSAYIYGKVSLCSKTPWLFPRASIKQNILSNHIYNSQKYQRTINICNLDRDFQYMPKGESTIVGRKGDINITRELALKISIARGLYRDAKVYIFDGVFDQLSAQSSSILLQIILARGIQENKCIVLFSQRPWLVSQTQRQFKIAFDRIVEIDTRRERIDSLTGGYETEEQPEEDVSEDHVSTEKLTPNFRDVRVAWKVMQNSPVSKNKLLDDKGSRRKTASSSTKEGPPTEFFIPFSSIVSAMTFAVLSGIVVSGLLQNVITAGWHYVCLNQSILPTTIENPILQVLLGLSIASSLLHMIQYYWLFTNFLEAIYERLISSVSSLKHWQKKKRESIIFIMQQIMPNLDKNFTSTVVQFFKMLTYVAALTIMVLYNPYTLIQGVAMSLCLVYIGKYCGGYVTKLWHLQNELWGIVKVYYEFEDEQILSIRSLDSSKMYRMLFHEHMDNYTSIQYMAKSALEGISFWMGLVCVMNIGLLLLIGVMTGYGVENSIAVFFSLLLPNLFPLLIEHMIKLLYYAGNVNMIVKYIDKKPMQSVKIDKGLYNDHKIYQKEGFIESKFVVCKVNNRIVYLNFSVDYGEMIGVLGDGKRAIPALLYGYCEILSGGVTIKNAQNALRNGYISTNPHIFNGTLIESLSFGKRVTDDTMSAAIAKVGLSSEVNILPQGLKTASSNWSGMFNPYQRQLLYLAGSIATESQVILIRFDPTKCSRKEEMDVMMKARVHLPNSTIFILSNRLRTVLKINKTMVFKGGALLEFKETQELIADSSSCLNSYINAVKQRIVRKELRDMPYTTAAESTNENTD